MLGFQYIGFVWHMIFQSALKLCTHTPGITLSTSICNSEYQEVKNPANEISQLILIRIKTTVTLK